MEHINLNPKYFQISTNLVQNLCKNSGNLWQWLEAWSSKWAHMLLMLQRRSGWRVRVAGYRVARPWRAAGVWYTWLIFHNYGYLLTCNLALGDTHLLTTWRRVLAVRRLATHPSLNLFKIIYIFQVTSKCQSLSSCSAAAQKRCIKIFYLIYLLGSSEP